LKIKKRRFFLCLSC